jgi:hypothetical protein
MEENEIQQPMAPPEIRGMFGTKGDSATWLGKYQYQYQ